MSELNRLIDHPEDPLDRVLLESMLDDEAPPPTKTLAALGLASTAIGVGAAVGAAGVGAKTGALGGVGSVGLWTVGTKFTLGLVLVGSLVGGGLLASGRLGANSGATAALESSETSTNRNDAVGDVEGSRLPARATASPVAVLTASAGVGAADDAPPAKSGSLAPESLDRKVGVKPTAARPELAPTPTPAPAGGASLKEELSVLDQARRALVEGRPEVCLERLSVYAGRFPKGQLVDEASALRARCTR